ncbi:MAG TPA: hypothetical protein VFN27_02050, partial [Xanthobacteraceae bacterium]|nr:hypothetical protein [Xanthobacteraceae bacterium]
YLNVPPARIPGEGGAQLDDLPADGELIRAALLDAFDRQRQVDLAARLVARHLTLGHSPQALIATLARALLREDAGFHAYQMLEAGVRQFTAWGDTDEGRHILIAVARYLAAHSPTERAALQTADIARRLMRGGELPVTVYDYRPNLFTAHQTTKSSDSVSLHPCSTREAL